MAGAIKRQDIWTDEAYNSPKEFNAQLQTVLTSLQQLISIGKEVSKTFGNADNIRQLNEGVKKQNEVLEKSSKVKSKLVTLEQQRIKIETQVRNNFTKNLALQEKQALSLEKSRQAIQRNNRERKLAVIAMQAEKGSYEAISAALSANLVKYKRMSEQERETSKAGQKLAETIRKQRDALTKLDSRLGNHSRKVGSYRESIMSTTRSLVGALGFAGGIMTVVKVMRNAIGTMVKFEQAQSTLLALSGKTADQLEDLTEQALQLGSTTAYTATQVTELQIELTKLGFTTSQTELSTKAILNFASATGADLAAAAKTAGVALRAYGLDASRMEEVTATLAVSTTKSALSFADFDTVLSTVGPVAKAFGFTLQDTTAMIGKLKDAGFDASSSSTAFRNILLNLADANGKLAQRLGGSVRSFDELIPALVQLREDGVDLNETLQLTDKRSVSAFNTFLATAEGATELRDSITGVNEELQIMVDKKLDNMAGDMTKLSSAWEGFVLQGREGTNVFRGAIQFATDLITKLSNLDLVFKNLNESSAARGFDVAMSLNDKKAKQFQETIKKYEGQSIKFIAANKELIQEEIKAAGFGTKNSLYLYNEFIKRRFEQHRVEVQAARDKQAQIIKDREKFEEEARALGIQFSDETTNAQLQVLIDAEKQRIEEAKRADLQIKANRLGITLDMGKSVADIEKQIADKIGKDREKAEKDANAKILKERKKTADHAKRLEEDARKENERIKQDEFKAIEEEVLAELDGINEKYMTDEELAKDFAETQAKLNKSQKDVEIKQQEEAEAKKKAIQEAGINAVSGLVGSYFEIRKNNLQKEFDLLELQKEAELANENLTAEEKEKIEKRYADKAAAIKTKQAKAERREAIISTIVNTSKSVVAALPNLVLAGISAALGLAQLAVIKSQPVPKYAKGRKGGRSEVAEIAEKGREMWIGKHGVSVVEKRSVVQLGEGDIIKTNAETERILKAAEQSDRLIYDSKDLKHSGTGSLVQVLDRNNEKLINTIQNKKELQINVRRGAISVTEREGNYYRNYLNTFK